MVKYKGKKAKLSRFCLCKKMCTFLCFFGILIVSRYKEFFYIMEYAYGRVSAKDQNLDRQIAEFIKFGVSRQNIFAEKKSGKDFERAAYKRLIATLTSGDLLIIKSIDRLGRNYDEIIFEWDRIVNKIKADILVLDMPLLDTRVKKDTLIGKFISDIVLQILSFVAENERTNIKARQAEGIKAARAKGVKFGRPKTQYTKQFLTVVKQYKSGLLSGKQAAFLAQMSRQRFSYHLKKLYT